VVSRCRGIVCLLVGLNCLFAESSIVRGLGKEEKRKYIRNDECVGMNVVWDIEVGNTCLRPWRGGKC
jgi:hypothetical protein